MLQVASMAMLTQQRLAGTRDLPHGELLHMLLDANTPRATRSAPVEPRGMSLRRAGNVARVAVQRPRTRADTDTPTAYDEEAIKTRKFWEKFAREASKDLLKDFGKQPDGIGHEQLLYSGRVGIEAKYPPNIPDDDSIITEISLLTCSDGKAAQNGVRRRRRQKKPDAGGGKKASWADAARETYGGVLGRMLEKDTGALQGLTAGDHAYGSLKSKLMSELLSEEEQGLLMKCGRTKPGVFSKDKSFSTENIMTCGGIKGRPPSKQLNRQASKTSSGRETPAHGYKATGRTPSPRAIARTLAQTKRAESIPVRIGSHSQVMPQRKRTSSSHQHVIYGNLPSESVAPQPISQDHPSNMHTKHIHAQIQTTVSALDRIAGHGDQTYEMKSIPEEKGLYTEADYSRIPRYPQNVRVAPQLVRVITAEMKRRASQPRQYELKKQDVYKFDRIQPSLDQASRNLFIFNWLNHLDERDFLEDSLPDISQTGSGRLRLASVDHSDFDHTVTVPPEMPPSPTYQYSNAGSHDVIDDVDNDVMVDVCDDDFGDAPSEHMSDDFSEGSGDFSDGSGDVDSNGPAVGSLSNFSL